MVDMQTLNSNSPRDLARGSREVLVLAILADGRQYGYAIQKRFRQATGEPLQPGSLYPLLHRLEEEGWVRAERETSTGRPRRWYTLTEAGQRRLRAAAAAWQASIARMQSLVLPALRRLPHPTPACATPPGTAAEP
jgi:DNA-binding PadR family transcriptional regulator